MKYRARTTVKHNETKYAPGKIIPDLTSSEAKRLLALGAVEAEAEETSKIKEFQDYTEADLKKLTVARLKALCADNEVIIPADTTQKDDIIAFIMGVISPE